jgi:hypothetical protein
VLVFSAGIDREAIIDQIPGQTIIGIETFLIRTAKIVNDALAKMIAVV